MEFYILVNYWIVLVFQKIIAEPGSKERSKLGIIASGTADLELSLPPRILEPYAQYFYPQPGVRNERIIKNYKVGTPIVSANIYPLKDPVRTFNFVIY